MDRVKMLFGRAFGRAEDESGFTLIELLITILIAAVLALAVIFALGGFAGQAQGSNAETMAGVAKTAAISRSTFYGGGSYYGITSAELQSDQSGISLTTTDPVYLASFTPVKGDGTTPCTESNGCVGFNLTVDATDGTFTDKYSIDYNGTTYTYPDEVKGVVGTW